MGDSLKIGKWPLINWVLWEKGKNSRTGGFDWVRAEKGAPFPQMEKHTPGEVGTHELGTGEKGHTHGRVCRGGKTQGGEWKKARNERDKILGAVDRKGTLKKRE